MSESSSSSPEDSSQEYSNSSKAKNTQEKSSKVESPKVKSPKDSDTDSDSESSKLSNTRSDSSQPAEKLKNHSDVSYEWRTFKMPTVPPPDDSQIEAELNQHYDIIALFQQMRSVS